MDSDFLPLVEKVNGDVLTSKDELLSLALDYYLLEMPNLDEYWYETSKVPSGFFKEMNKLSSLFYRSQFIDIPVFVMHGELDDMSPVIY